MQSKKKFLFLISLVAAFSILFSCGSDDDDKKPEPHKIVGTWTYSDMDYDITINGENYITYLVENFEISELEAQTLANDIFFVQEFEDELTDTSITFNADGTYVVKDGTTVEETGKYSLQNNDTKLNMNPDDDDYENLEWEITEFTNNRLTLDYTEESMEDLDEDGVDESILSSIELTYMK